MNQSKNVNMNCDYDAMTLLSECPRFERKT